MRGVRVTRRRRSSGYALLAVVLIAALGVTFALLIVGAVHALQLVAVADSSSGRAALVEETAVAQTMDGLRWSPSRATGSLSGADAGLLESFTASWEVGPPVGSSPWPRRSLLVVASAAGASRTYAATLEVRREDWAVGVTCEGDAEIVAPFTVAGSGVYVGGCLRGREQVDVVPGAAGLTAAGDPRDGARPESFTAAAAHAEAGIFARGVEIHDPSASCEFPLDTDPHTGAAFPAAWVAGPTPEFLVAARARAESPGPAFSDGTLHLDALGAADAAQQVSGRCIVLPPCDEVTIEGVAPADSGPILVVVEGDAVIGQPGERVGLSGGLVVCGQLRVRSELSVQGSLHAGSLQVDAPTSVALPGDWRDRPLPGAARPVVVELAT